MEAIRAAREVNTEYVLSVFNNLLRRESFPELWRVVRVVLLLKEGRTAEIKTEYKLIFLLLD